MDRMKWSTKLPTVKGQYWIKDTYGNVVIERVWRKKGFGDFVIGDDDHPVHLKDTKGWKFCGPLPEPED
jgi:hypothetical protein